MRVTSIQLLMQDRGKEGNLSYALAMLDRCPESELILLPEIWTSGFFRFERYAAESETLDGPLVDRFRTWVRQRGCHLHMGSMVERDGECFFNTSLLFDRAGEIIGRYRKMHLFGYQSQERRLLTAGTEVVVVKTPWGLVGLSTCYDLRFPEFFRKMVDLGVEVFLVAAAWPMARLSAWSLFNRVRALENLAFLFSCNCAGSDAGQRYGGHSALVDPLGNVIAEGGEGEGYVSAEVDLNLVGSVRKDFPALEDRVIK